MSRIFISHSSHDDAQALSLAEWLRTQGWSDENDLFLDIHADQGIAAGERWMKALEGAAGRCEAVLFLISEQWLASKMCYDEFHLASRMGKKLFALLLEDLPFKRLPGTLTAHWQIVRLFQQPTQRFEPQHPLADEKQLAYLSTDGLTRLKRGLINSGIAPETFDLQPDADGPFGWRNPYRGMEALDAEDAAVFFGRDAELVRALDILRGLALRPQPRIFVILGASGAGKSSFLRAGLRPRMQRADTDWLMLPPIRVGGDGAIEGREGLLTAMEDVHRRFDLPRSRAELREDLSTPKRFASLLETLQNHSAKRALLESEDSLPLAVLAIDQAEELFAAIGESQGRQLLELLPPLLRTGNLLLMATIRSDAYSLMQSSSALTGFHQTTFSLPPVPVGEWAQLIRAPGDLLRRKVGPKAPVFTPEVVEALQSEIHGEQDALPLLGFTLQRLIREHSGAVNEHGRAEISPKQLQKSGGVAAAVFAAAEGVLDHVDLPTVREARAAAVRAAFVPHLIAIDPKTGNAHRRIAQVSDFKSETSRKLVEALVESRLLVKKQGSAGATVEVAHEALIRRWPRLRALLTAERDALLLLDSVLQAAKEWREAVEPHKDELLVHQGTRLSEAEALAQRGEGWAKKLVLAQDYLATCRRSEQNRQEAEALRLHRQRRLQRRASVLLTMFALLVLGVAGFAVSQQRNASKQLSLVLAERAETALQAHEEDRAVRLAVLAARSSWLNPTATEAEPMLMRSAHFSTLKLEVPGDFPLLDRVEDKLSTIVVGHDGSVLFRVWDALTGQELSAYNVIAPARSIASCKVGHSILSWHADGSVRIWSAANGPNLIPVSTGRQVVGASCDPSGRRVLIFGAAGSAWVWDAANGTLQARLVYGSPLNGAVFSSDGERVLSWHDDGNLQMWDGTSLSIVAGLKPSTPIRSAKFDTGGNRFLSVHGDGSVRVWDVITGEMLGMQEHDQWGGALFDPSGAYVLSWGMYDAVKVWSVDGTLRAEQDHDGLYIRGAQFNSDGSQVLSWGDDRKVKVWDAGTGTVLREIAHRKRVMGAKFSPMTEITAALSSGDEQLILSWDFDGTARTWLVSSGEDVSHQSHGNPIVSTMFSDDGKHVLSWDVAGGVRVWGAMTGQVIARQNHQSVVSSATFIDNDRSIVSSGGDGSVKIWSVPLGEHFPVQMHNGVVSKSRLNGPLLLSKAGRSAQVWDASSRRILARLEHNQHILGAMFIQDADRVLSWDSDEMTIWGARTGKELAHHELGERISSALVSDDGQRALWWNDKGGVWVWHTESGQKRPIPVDNKKAIGGLVDPKGQSVVLWDDDGSVSVWDLESGSLLWRNAHDAEINGAQFSRDGYRLLLWHQDGSLYVRTSDTGVVQAEMKHSSSIAGAAFDTNSARVLFWDAGGSVEVWDADTGESLAGKRHNDQVIGAVFDQEGERVLTWDSDKMLVWEAETGEEISVINAGANGALFDAVRQRILSWRGDIVSVREVATGKELARWDHGHWSNIAGATFLENGQRVMTWGSRGINIWSAEYSLTSEDRNELNIPELLDAVCDPAQGKLRGHLRIITADDVAAVGMLRGRVGEDVCTEINHGFL